MRTTIISTKHLSKYKTAVYSGIVLTTAAIAGLAIFGIVHQQYWHLPAQLVFLFIIVTRVELLQKLKNVSYDDGNIYYNIQDYEEQIPFHQIKEVQLHSVNGIYKIALRAPGQAGKEIFFKPSVWYPFNFNKQDEKVDALRKAIRKYMQSPPSQPSGIPLAGANLLSGDDSSVVDGR